MSEGETKAYLAQVVQVSESIDDWSASNLEQVFHAFQEKSGLKPRPAFMTIRLAITGEAATPPLFDVMAVLGKETVLRRLRAF